MWHAAATGMAAARDEVFKFVCERAIMYVWTAAIGEELICHTEQRNVHDFNPTKCTTISNYSMSVNDEAESGPYPGASRHTYACQMHLRSYWELSGLPQPSIIISAEGMTP